VKNKSSIFIHPRGFIEQHYHDGQTPESSMNAIKQLEKYINRLHNQDKAVLIFIDVSKLKKIDLSGKMLHVRLAAAKAMKDQTFNKAAIYGPLPVQVLVTTLALVSGKSKVVKVFDNRAQAVKWLLE
jgi:fatty acid-binding protein DegV